MRVVLVGSSPRRRRLRAQLPESVEVVAEAVSIREARAAAPDVDAYIVAPLAERNDERLVEPLTTRESDVLVLVADGLSNKAIAGRLGISDETVKFHLSSIFGKLRATNRTDAVRQALRRGLVPL